LPQSLESYAVTPLVLAIMPQSLVESTRLYDEKSKILRQFDEAVGNVMIELDDIDRRMLALLANNARLSVTALARDLGIARTTAQARLDRLENRGVIAGYALRLSDRARQQVIRATVLVQIEPRSQAGILRALDRMVEVEAAYTTSGRFDLTLEVAAQNPEALDAALDRIAALVGVRGHETLVHLSSKIERRIG